MFNPTKKGRDLISAPKSFSGFYNFFLETSYIEAFNNSLAEPDLTATLTEPNCKKKKTVGSL
jgi:hypothetical protein